MNDLNRPEPLTMSLVVGAITDLRVNFPGKRDTMSVQRLAEIYFGGLTGISPAALSHAVKRAIQDDSYFPKVARIRELAASFESYQRNTRPPNAADEQRCSLCGEDFHLIRKHRPRFERIPNGDGTVETKFEGGWLTSADGEWLLLEAYDRLGCRCSASDGHLPNPDLDPPAERIVQGTWFPVALRRTDIQPA